ARQPGRGAAHARSGGAQADRRRGGGGRARMPGKGAAVRFVLAMPVLVFLWIAPALADLYRWVDPETGRVKFSSYPPPWFNDAASQGRAPKVEVIAPSKMAPAFAPETEGEPAPKAAERGVSRDALMKQVTQRVAALASSAPEAMGQAYAEL